MASDLKKERDELQQELYRATENIKGLESTLKSVRALSDDRAQKLNAVESTSYKLREELATQTENARLYRNLAESRATKINALNSNIDNLNKAYDELLARFNALQRRNPVPHASWEAAYNIEREQKIQAYKDVEALKWENEDLKHDVEHWKSIADRPTCQIEKDNIDLKAKHDQYEKTIADLRELADGYYNDLVERGNKIDDYEKRIIDLRESSQQKTRLIESLNKRFDNEHFNLNRAHEALKTTQLDRDTWRNSFSKSEDARRMLLDRVIEREDEIGRLSRFEPLEQAELKELEYLRAEYENAKNTIKSQELTYNNLLENSKLIEKENTELYDKYDKLKTGIETLCEANNIRE